MYKYPSIEQIRHVITGLTLSARYAGKDENGEAIYDSSVTLPTVTFNGTVKIHGTNAGIIFPQNREEVYFQSRERVLSLEADNSGFMLNLSNTFKVFPSIVSSLLDYARFCNDFVSIDDYTVCIYGEWCGPGIQKSVAVNSIPNKIFVIFGIKLVSRDDVHTWLKLRDAEQFTHLNGSNIYFINQFGEYSVTVDLNSEASKAEFQNQVIALTDEVERECPVGKFFGVTGVGEGIVFSTTFKNNRFQFKSKGEKHSVSKVRTIKPVDVERAEEVEKFVSLVVTESRLEQGLHVLKNELLLPLNVKSTGDFVRWVYTDVLKEEGDLIVQYNIDTKKLGSLISTKARNWFIKTVNEI